MGIRIYDQNQERCGVNFEWLSLPNASWYLAQVPWPWDSAREFFRSEFFAGLFGAGVGAAGAYVFASRSERRRARLLEISRANAAIALAHHIINTAVTMKKQHVKSLINDYRAERKKAGEAQASGARVIEVSMNMMTLNVPYLAGDELQATVVNGVLRSAHANIIAVQARQSAESFMAVLKSRNELCAEIKAAPFQERISIFLAQTDANGGDLRYPALMDAIESYIDDCIYFSMLLQDVLKAHVDRIRRKMWWRAPRALSFDYSKAVEWLPDRAHYTDFENEFRKEKTLAEKIRQWPGRWWRGV